MEINKLNTANAHPAQKGHRASKSRGSIELDATKEKSGLLEDAEPQSSAASGDTAGIYLGLLNVYTTLPQFIGTFISWIVFSILEPGKSPELAKEAHPDEHHGTDGWNAIAVCLFIGALAAVVAAYATERFKQILSRHRA
jgi:solute carrier family 45 protein 1/2/4